MHRGQPFHLDNRHRKIHTSTDRRIRGKTMPAHKNKTSKLSRLLRPFARPLFRLALRLLERFAAAYLEERNCSDRANVEPSADEENPNGKQD